MKYSFVKLSLLFFFLVKGSLVQLRVVYISLVFLSLVLLSLVLLYYLLYLDFFLVKCSLVYFS